MKQEDKEGLVILVMNILRDECNKNAENHGFWEDEDQILDMLIRCGVTKNDHNCSRIVSLFNSEKIALEMSELAERLEVLRKDPTKLDEHCPELFNIEIECADLIIRCLDFCGRRKLRIGEAIIAKMKFNKERPIKHGKNF